MRWMRVALVLLLACAWSRDALAQTELPVDLDLAIATHVPVSIGAEATLEIPYRILFQIHMGWMPSAYVDTINDTAVALDGYDETTAALLEAAVDDSFVLRLSAGVRPFAGAGFEILAGYTLITAGGNVSRAEMISETSGQDVSALAGDIPIATTLHALHAAIGWRWVIERHFIVRLAIGWVHTIGSNTEIGDDDRIRSNRNLERAVEAAEAYLDEDIFQTWGFSPEIQLGAGYRF